MIFFSYANVIRTQYLLPHKKDTSYIISVLVGAIVNFVVNAMLIPRYEAVGAVIGTLCAEAIVCILQMWFVRKELDVKRYYMHIPPFIIAGALMAVLVRTISKLTHGGIIGLLLEVGMGAMLYILLSVIYVYISNRNLFNKLLKIKHKN